MNNVMEEKVRLWTRQDIRSLVDFVNHRATNLYEKFGFKKSYIRMIYHEEEI